MFRICVAAAIGWGLLWGGAHADSLPRRQTADWQADLIRALIDDEMLDSAEAICARHFSLTEASTDDAARWAIRWSSVRAARLTSTTDWQPQAAAAARQPIEKLLQAYPHHTRRPWLETQLGIIDMATVRHAVLALAITPGQADLQTRGLDFVRSALRRWEAVEEQIQTLNPAADQDLRTLQQTLGIQRVEALLWRSRLFVTGSEDAIASATEAEGEARQVLSRMGSGTRTHERVMLLRAEALTAMGNPDQALQTLDDVQRLADGQMSVEGLALQVRALLAKQDGAAAAKLLDAYYGTAPQRAPRALELDLARLAYLLSTVDSGGDDSGGDAGSQREQRLKQVADWLDAIQRRSGVYARRRGEAETLRVVRVRPSGGDTRLLAAEAARQLRSGNARQAGQLLAQAAAASDDAAMALRYAAQAAAVLKSVDRLAEAAEVLTATAIQHAAHESAAGLHLQAAWLTAEAMQQDGDGDIAVLQSILEATARRWPATAQSRQAIDWLVRLLQAHRRYAEAAAWMLSDSYPPSLASLRQGARLWQLALRQQVDAEPIAAGELLERALASLQSPSAQEAEEWTAERRRQRLRLAALFASPQDLRQRYAELGASHADGFAASLLKFRRDAVSADTLVLPAAGQQGEEADEWNQTLADAVQRLQRDGQAAAAERTRLGRGMLRLLDAIRESAAAEDRLRGRALAWTGQWQQAEQLFQKQIDASPGNLNAVRAAAEGLGESADPQAKRRAVRYWTQIAAGVPQGSEPWHQAKLATIRLHLAVQDREAAIKLGRYVLITRPPEDQTVREQYEQLLRQAGEQH